MPHCRRSYHHLNGISFSLGSTVLQVNIIYSGRHPPPPTVLPMVRLPVYGRIKIEHFGS